MQHVKPHGALYNTAAADSAIAGAIATAVTAVDPALILFGLAGSELLTAGQRAGLRTASEGFADRSYGSEGTLTPRSDPRALIDDPAIAVAQAVQMVIERKVGSLEGNDIELHVDTICIHGDSPHALNFAQAICEGLRAEAIEVKPLSS